MVVLEGRVCRAFALRRRLRRMRAFSVKVRGVREDRGQGTLAYLYGADGLRRVRLLRQRQEAEELRLLR